jgi:hypothetical protein
MQAQCATRKSTTFENHFFFSLLSAELAIARSYFGMTDDP